MITRLIIGWYIKGIPGVYLIINGTLAGLVAITASFMQLQVFVP